MASFSGAAPFSGGWKLPGVTLGGYVPQQQTIGSSQNAVNLKAMESLLQNPATTAPQVAAPTTPSPNDMIRDMMVRYGGPTLGGYGTGEGGAGNANTLSYNPTFWQAVGKAGLEPDLPTDKTKIPLQQQGLGWMRDPMGIKWKMKA